MVVDFFSIFWLLFLLITLLPLYKQRNIQTARLKKIREIEVKRKSRVIALIHRQESFSLLGLPITRYINIFKLLVVSRKSESPYGSRLTPWAIFVFSSKSFK